MKVIDVHNQLLTEWDKPSDNPTNLHATADTCKKHLVLLPSLLHGITVVELENFEIYSNEVRRLLYILMNLIMISMLKCCHLKPYMNSTFIVAYYRLDSLQVRTSV